MKHLSIDLETYSSVPITKAGAYKYAESPDFEILLLAYSLDGGAVEIIDLKQGEHTPAWLLEALTDPAYIKHAYNAAFEIICLSEFLGRQLDPAQWRCTMLHGLYCGFPAGLGAIGSAMGLPEDKRKLSTGRALIRYFCVPCSPSKANGGRTRNLPHHDTAKWELFKQYCIGDVITESEILRRLSRFPVPEDVEIQWQTDMRINTRGVAVDMKLVRGALAIGDRTRNALIAEATQISGIQNPNSVGQLCAWLEAELGEEVPNMQKATVERLLGGDMPSNTARRLLEIRQELGKTSTKKYDAIVAAVCADERVRGLFQFYGANRTGRWAGRLVQVQNLPRTYLCALSLARECVRQCETDKLRALYGSVPHTLSQLIRTALVAKRGHTLIDADFSAIEARVIAWLAGEQWRLDVFRTHGKIYEASASQMFGVPLELISKGNPEYELRQRGKVAELALGYQGGVGAMRAMDVGHQLDDLSDEGVGEIVQRWRDTNPRIVALWRAVQDAAISVVQSGAPCTLRGLSFAREIDRENNLDFLTVQLPSGRKLFYANPALGTNRWGCPSLSYSGMNQTTKKWERVETYGGKSVENITQAIARDCLAEAIERLEGAGYSVIMHIHDEVVIECPTENTDLNHVIGIMAEPVSWAPDLPLAADGWVSPYYKKD